MTLVQVLLFCIMDCIAHFVFWIERREMYKAWVLIAAADSFLLLKTQKRNVVLRVGRVIFSRL